jgi:hypothetical protein
MPDNHDDIEDFILAVFTKAPISTRKEHYQHLRCGDAQHHG